MRRPTLSNLAVGSVAAVALTLSAAAPSLADDAVPAPSASETEAAAETLPPADPIAPVEATTTVESDPSVTATSTPETASETPAEETTPTATPTATPTIGGNGAYSYPFVLTPGEDGAATVAIEVAGTGVSVAYTVDEKGKVTEALVAAGAATLVKTTPHTIFLVLESGESVKVKVHGDSVRVKVKPVSGGPLRPGISTPEEVAEDEAAAAAEDSEAPEESDAAKPAKENKEKKDQQKQAKKQKKGKKAKKSRG